MNVKFLLAACTASGAVAIGSSAAMAGGAIAPIVEVAPIEISPAPVAGAWEGAYAGGSLGYLFGTDDEIGLATIVGGSQVARSTNLGDVGVSGVTAGLHVGYRWQRDRWVFGPELGVEFGGVDEKVNGTFGGSPFELESEMKNVVTLVMKTGYSVDPQTLVYGTFGVARGSYDYTLTRGGNSTTEGFSATGVAAGLGFERMMSDTMSVFGEYQYRHLGNTDVDFSTGANSSLRSVASTSHSSIKVGVNFKF